MVAFFPLYDLELIARLLVIDVAWKQRMGVSTGSYFRWPSVLASLR